MSFLSLSLSATPAWADLAGILSTDDTLVVRTLGHALTSAGYQTITLDAQALCNPERLAPLDLLAIPNAATLPADSVQPIEAYLHAGGDIIALNTPIWRTLLVNIDGQWVSRVQYARENAATLPEDLLVDFSPGSTDSWQRSTSETGTAATYETVPDGPDPSRRSLHVKLDSYRGWDTFGPESLDSPFPPGHTLTVFAARGGPDTPSLAVEWREKDGSRWIATVPLTTEWRQYVLAPKDFKFWESNPARKNDTFNPANAATMTVGLAVTHTGPGPLSQQYWLANFGTTQLTPQLSKLLTQPNVPKLDTLSPTYKFFNITNATQFHPSSFIIHPSLPIPQTPNPIPHTRSVNCGAGVPPALSSSRLQTPVSGLSSLHPRPTAAGFDKARDWCFIPILEARSPQGASARPQWCGIPAAMTIHADGPFKGGQWASFAIDDPAWYKSPDASNLIQAVGLNMIRGLHIIDAGSNFYTYFDGQQPTVGMRIANCGAQVQNATARVTVTPLQWDGPTPPRLFSKEWPMELPPDCETRVADVWRPELWSQIGFLVTAELVQDGHVIENIAHEIHVWRPNHDKKFVSVKDGDFFLDGKRWRAHGVNYMPSTGIAAEDGQYFEQWLSARSYSPEAVDRDLDHILDLGLNSVSIFLYHQTLPSQNLLDFLRRLELRGLKANLSLRPGTPMDFAFVRAEWGKIREIIQYYRLPENDTVFAYDLAWEPLWMFQADRRRWDADWEAWVVDRYGSIQNAERDWEFPIPRDQNGNVTNPPAEHTDEDGPWRRMLAAYRRFLDTLLYKHYSKARELVRSVDPNHLVSFRMTEAGDPTMAWRGVMPYDFPYLAAAVDLLEPEAYGRIGDWEKVKPGWFEYEYARWAAPDLPMMWAEAGVSTWDPGTMRTPDDKLQFQADYFAHFYRMLISSGADGIFWWWYPGGFRVGENSDYGIINPDGSDRPASRVIRQNAQPFIDGPPAPAIDTWILIDRDARAEGLPGIYKLVADQFWKTIDDGKVPGLKTAGTGSTSADCPLIAVGNTPCNGSNPPKYLDAWFDAVEPNPDGTTRIRVTNLGEATWLSEKRGLARLFRQFEKGVPVPAFRALSTACPLAPGAVYLTARAGSQTTNFPLTQNVPPRKTTTFNITLPQGQVQLRLECNGRTPFGPILNLNPN